MGYSSLSPEELVRTCAQSGDAAAWQEFVQRFHCVIASVVLRTARHWREPSPHVVDDLVQETYLKLCADGSRLLREFEPRYPDSIFGYLKIVAANVVHDHFKALHAEKRGAGVLNESLCEAEPFPANESVGNRNLLLEKIYRYLDECAPGPEHQRDRMIFWLYYRQGLSARAIAAMPSVALSTKGVESAILRLTRLIRSRIMRGAGIDRNDPHQGRSISEGILPSESF
jgi:RNA polymerase sigma-70 factor (ECF subfamily)